MPARQGKLEVVMPLEVWLMDDMADYQSEMMVWA